MTILIRITNVQLTLYAIQFSALKSSRVIHSTSNAIQFTLNSASILNPFFLICLFFKNNTVNILLFRNNLFKLFFSIHIFKKFITLSYKKRRRSKHELLLQPVPDIVFSVCAVFYIAQIQIKTAPVKVLFTQIPCL